jgi:hypothetical protein
MNPNPYDDPDFRRHKTAVEVAEQALLRRLIAEFFAAKKQLRAAGTDQVWDFEQKCLRDLESQEWPGADPEEQKRVKGLAVSYLSDFLATIKNP